MPGKNTAPVAFFFAFLLSTGFLGKESLKAFGGSRRNNTTKKCNIFFEGMYARQSIYQA